MGSEILLYGYGIVCLSMLVFNAVYNIIMKGSEFRLERRSRSFEEKILQQAERLRGGRPMDEKHFSYLQRKLSHINNLLAFDQAMEKELEEESGISLQRYWEKMEPVILHLAIVYQKRDNLQAAYFAYFLSRYKKRTRMVIDSVQEIIVGYMEKDSLYCRVNALQALYSFGSIDSIVKAIAIQDASGAFLHEKILTEGLLSYKGDHDRLIHRLWEEMERFSDRTKLSILNYIRFKTGDYCEEMLAIMTDESIDKELRFSAIRYFGRYPYEAARQTLLDFASDRNPENWEYAAISATALARYPGDDVIEVLTAAMHSSNWYIRYNAAESLEAHGLRYGDLIDIVGGKDRYAREMIMYRLETRRLEEERKRKEEAKEK